MRHGCYTTLEFLLELREDGGIRKWKHFSSKNKEIKKEAFTFSTTELCLIHASVDHEL